MNPDQNEVIEELKATIARLELTIDRAVSYAIDAGDEDLAEELVEMAEG